MSRRFSKIVARVFAIDGRLGVYGLKGVCRSGKAMIEYGTNVLSPGTMVWDLSVLGGPVAVPGRTVFVTLHVVLWVKSWNNYDREIGKKALVKFRPATVEEHAVETVMNE